MLFILMQIYFTAKQMVKNIVVYLIDAISYRLPKIRDENIRLSAVIVALTVPVAISLRHALFIIRIF